MHTVKVSLGVRSYTIAIGNQLLPRLGQECRRLQLGNRCAVVTDELVAPHYAGTVLTSLREAGFDPVLVTVPAGETSKSLDVVAAGYDQLAAHRLERRSFVVALGGGVVGDLAGFLAATYLRGVDFVQVPTTLLAQVDSSVGGKVGVNLKAGKNLVGAFWQPRLVWCDLDTLETLPAREFRAGLAEVIKYGVIYDAELFGRLEQDLPRVLARDPEVLSAVVARCCQIKAAVVAEDETESGSRAILNFGHTIGHGLEAIAGYGEYLHGEAIAIGQALAAELSSRLLAFPAREAERLVRLLDQAGLPTRVSLTSSQRARLLEAMRHDKKVSGGVIKFVLANKLGQVSFGQPVPPEVLEDVLSQASDPTPAGAGAVSSNPPSPN
jgi:3-dehydroquinate synthase